MNTDHGRYHARILFGITACLLALVLIMAAGCGKKQPIETDVPAPEPPPSTIEDLPPPVQTEDPAEEPGGIPSRDFGLMDPFEYGIDDVYFDFDVYVLSDEAMTTLAGNARIMRDHTDVVWLVEGHCDERGTVEYNLALGEKRAIASRDYLVSLGIPAHQLRITSYGEERPFVLGSSEEAWAQNRRAHFARP